MNTPAIMNDGSNSHGQLGQGLISEQVPEPVVVGLDVNVKIITGGGKHSIIATETGLYSCGDNDQRQLSGDGLVKAQLHFQKISFKMRIEKVSCGWDFNLALTEEGILYGWGGNSFGLRHSVIVTEEGFAFSTGSGRKGQLGVALSDGARNLSGFTRVPSLVNARSVSCGENHTLLCTASGKVFAWGDNRFGQLGIDPAAETRVETPVVVHNIKCNRIHKLASGWSHNAVLTDDGNAVLWGRNDYGQLGEDRDEGWMPRSAGFLRGTRDLCLGSHHGIALKDNDDVVCWGWNEHGNCGDGNCTLTCDPVKLNTFGLKPRVIGSGYAHSFFCVS